MRKRLSNCLNEEEEYFAESVLDLAYRNYEGELPLEVFLHSLWQQAQEIRDKKLTPNVILRLLRRSFKMLPGDFDDEWTLYTEPPPLWAYVDETVDGFELFQETIFFQIADLHLISTGVWDVPDDAPPCYSPTGNVWYNLDPCFYLLNANLGLRHFRFHHPDKETVWDWRFFAQFLEVGRVYE